jgi:hypothetical protein
MIQEISMNHYLMCTEILVGEETTRNKMPLKLASVSFSNQCIQK